MRHFVQKYDGLGQVFLFCFEAGMNDILFH